eukprot:TRINITY_DN12858_c0_g1_i1.p1 TRINITY_DN12858_c0_g1~~TRINITY_DN12858_c0_g1_i1.p1  ORF type:complete len:197 (-),score=46.84 TRINITY_DN12858_c0_g1_i1:99-611(-)
MDKEKDVLYLVSVITQEKTNWMKPSLSSLLGSNTTINKNIEECDLDLQAFAQKAVALGVPTPHLIRAEGPHVGEIITKIVETKNIAVLVVGRRGLHQAQRMIVGSTSQYLVEHANCSIHVVKADFDPEEENLIRSKLKEEREKLQGHTSKFPISTFSGQTDVSSDEEVKT